MPRLATSCVVVLLLAVAQSAVAQTLGEVARQEEQRRKTAPAAGKVYTNSSLRPEPQPSSSPAATTQTPESSQTPPTPSSTAPGPAADQPGAGKAPATPPESPAKDEESWRKRIADERSALARAQIFLEALQSRINALSSDFVSRDDPAQREAIAADRQKALAESDRVKEEIKQRQKAIEDIQEEARRAGVPAGWVR